VQKYHDTLHAKDRKRINIPHLTESRNIVESWHHMQDCLHQNEIDWSHAIRRWYHQNVFEKSGTKVLCQMQRITYWHRYMRLIQRIE
jgi:hypothetical protein